MQKQLMYACLKSPKSLGYSLEISEKEMRKEDTCLM
jgi:hypothetical protein